MNNKHAIYKFLVFKISQIGLFLSKTTIFIFEISLKLYLQLQKNEFVMKIEPVSSDMYLNVCVCDKFLAARNGKK